MIHSKSEMKRLQHQAPEVVEREYFEMKRKLGIAVEALEHYSKFGLSLSYALDDGSRYVCSAELAREALAKITALPVQTAEAAP